MMSRPGEPQTELITDEEGPWGVYDVYCLRCAKRAISVAPVKAEHLDLWECPDCSTMSMTWHLRPMDDDEGR